MERSMVWGYDGVVADVVSDTVADEVTDVVEEVMNEAAVEDAAVDVVADEVAAAITVGSGAELLYVGSPVVGAEVVSLGVGSVVTAEGGSTVGFLEGASEVRSVGFSDGFSVGPSGVVPFESAEVVSMHHAPLRHCAVDLPLPPSSPSTAIGSDKPIVPLQLLHTNGEYVSFWSVEKRTLPAQPYIDGLLT